MTIPAEIAAQLADEAVGRLILFDIDSTEGHVYLQLGEDGYFDDTNGVRWLGSKMMQMGDVESPRNGEAPAFEVQLSYAYDPDVTDLVSAVRSYGLSAIDGRKAVLYFQYLAKHEEFFAPIYQPIRVASFTMRKLSYALEGPQTRRITLTCEGSNPLRGRPRSGRYTDADQRRREDGDPSCEFIPTNGWDEQSLFGI